MCIHSIEKSALMFEKVEDLPYFKFFVYLVIFRINQVAQGRLSFLENLGSGATKKNVNTFSV